MRGAAAHVQFAHAAEHGSVPAPAGSDHFREADPGPACRLPPAVLLLDVAARDLLAAQHNDITGLLMDIKPDSAAIQHR